MQSKLNPNQRFLNLVLIWFISLLGASEAQVYFKETTFDRFGYTRGIADKKYTEKLRAKVKQNFPNAKKTKVASYITTDSISEVISFYSILTGFRCTIVGDRFYYIFSRIDGQPANIIKVYQVPLSRMDQSFWPVRIDIIYVECPLTNLPKGLNRSYETFKQRVGRLAYPGELREDIAMLKMNELGSDAEVYVIDTTDPFYEVYLFFRRRYGRIRIIPARDGDLYVRDFELDATRTLGLQRAGMELHIRTDENPTITDRDGNSQSYLGHTLIQYIFWKSVMIN